MLPPHLLSSDTIPAEIKSLVNLEQMFRMMETLLPFEACLYHQVLPLSFQGESLHLGMVSVNDPQALEYIQQLLGSISYVIIPTQIVPKFHQTMLSTYLKYVESKKNVSPESKPATPVAAEVKPVAPQKNISPQENTPEVSFSEQDTFILNDTFILEDNPYVNDHPDAPPLFPITPSPAPVEASDSALPPAKRVKPFNLTAPPVPPVPSTPLELNIKVNHLSSPIEALKTFPPRILLPELLGRVLVGGIGRLYLERQEQEGRILWSQSGVLQSVLEHVPIQVFEEVIQELKTIVELPTAPIHGAQQVEVERSYQKHRILLRVRFMRNRHGEEATLQVLRGAALKFYEKKQIDRLGKDALSIAQQLKRKLENIRTEETEPLEGEQKREDPTLAELSQILESLNETLKRLD
ncbi:MAG: pilus assembly protein PilB [Prochlorotrichaceae cyanobacterium]|jgi:hypothetical protein